jgi:heme/copper-type cytochrome/quinol oxidase subunit 2
MMASAAATTAGIASLEARARVVRVALWVFIGVTVLTVISSFMVMARQLQMADPPLFIYALNSMAALLFWLVLMLAAIAICAWVYRAHANLHDAGVHGLVYSPGWAVGSYFIPFVNCVVPFKAMRELYNRSHGEPEHFAQISAGPVSSWWACHIPAVVLAAVLGLMVLVPMISNVWFTTPPAATSGMGLFNQLLWAGSAWFLMQTVDRITESQRYGVATANVFE